MIIKTYYILGDEMKNKLLKYEIAGFVILGIFGAILHFTYRWSGNSPIVALFCPINESPWEHLKLLFFPYIIYGIVEIAVLKNKNIISAKYVSIVIGMVMTIALFYTVTGALSRTIEWFNILTFYIGLGVAFCIDYKMIKSAFGNEGKNLLSIVMIIITTLIFILFTFIPAEIPLFQDPINFSYGIQ